MYPACRIQTNVFRLNQFFFRQSTETVYVDIFQSDPRVVFSVADVLACHRETRWYSDNAGVVLSVADVSLSSADSRSPVLS